MSPLESDTEMFDGSDAFDGLSPGAVGQLPKLTRAQLAQLERDGVIPAIPGVHIERTSGDLAALKRRREQAIRQVQLDLAAQPRAIQRKDGTVQEIPAGSFGNILTTDKLHGHANRMVCIRCGTAGSGVFRIGHDGAECWGGCPGAQKVG